MNPAAPREVAFSDVHGDIEAARAALQLAGAIDDEDRWIGGDLVVVQTGDSARSCICLNASSWRRPGPAVRSIRSTETTNS